jgi:hypothetical protein
VGLGNQAKGGITIGTLVTQPRPLMPLRYTSGGPVSDGIRSLFAEPSALLPKPYTAKQLLEAVEAVLNVGTESKLPL